MFDFIPNWIGIGSFQFLQTTIEPPIPTGVDIYDPHVKQMLSFSCLSRIWRHQNFPTCIIPYLLSVSQKRSARKRLLFCSCGSHSHSSLWSVGRSEMGSPNLWVLLTTSATVWLGMCSVLGNVGHHHQGRHPPITWAKGQNLGHSGHHHPSSVLAKWASPWVWSRVQFGQGTLSGQIIVAAGKCPFLKADWAR